MSEGMHYVTGKSFLNILIRPKKDVGTYFPIGESGVSQSNRRIYDKVKKGQKV